MASTYLPLLLAEAGVDLAYDELPAVLETVLDVDPGLSAGAALRNEPDAFVLHIESVALDPWKLVPKIVGLLVVP